MHSLRNYLQCMLLAFCLSHYVAKNVKIHLIGHSIGAWMVLQMLEEESVRRRVQKCYMLFPTVERMDETFNGLVLSNLTMPLYSMFGNTLISLFNALPDWLRLQVNSHISSIPDACLDTSLKYSKPSVAEKAMFLAKDELCRVRGLQREIIERNLHLLKFYYGVPVSYYEQLRRDFPKVDATLDAQNIDHCFVLRQSKPMAGIVRQMIQQSRRK